MPGVKTTDISRKTVTDVEFLGDVTFPTGYTYQGTQVGGLSGIAYNPSKNVYYSISDDRSQFNPARFYTLSIDLSDTQLDEGDITFKNVTTLTDENGNPFPELSLDPEGIALTDTGTVFISSEGERSPSQLINPFVNEFSLKGQQLRELPVPDKFEPAGTGADDSGIRNNLAFESLTITPDRRFLFTATENALVQDGPAAGLETESPSRILQYDLKTGQPIKEFLYFTDPVAAAPDPAGAFSTNGLVELLALDNSGTFLSLERSFSTGVGNTIKLYEVSLQGATDIGDFESVEGFEVEAVAEKRLLLDFADLGLTPDNIEGLALGPVLPDGRQSLIAVSDNNFSNTQSTQFLSFALDLDTIPGVSPTVETPTALDVDDPPEGVTRGDADDPAIYVHPYDPSQSLVIGSLKDGGLQVYDLNGRVLQTIAPDDIRYNNVDVLYGFNLGSQPVDLAIAPDRENDTLAIFKIDPHTRRLEDITSARITESIFGVDDGEQTAYGLTTYRSPLSGEFYAFVSQREGNQVAQLKLVDDGRGGVTAELVRTLTVPIPQDGELEDAQVEGMVADRELGYLYVGQENVGIWKFSAEPEGSSEGSLIDQVAPNGSNLVADVEGLTIYYGENGTGYLLASSQGDSTFVAYSREGDNTYLGNFQVGASGGIDSVQNSDGADVINVPLSPQFPFGLLVVHDGSNDPTVVVEDDGELENVSTNFKFVPWENVANAFSEPLAIAPSGYDPRNPDTTLASPGINLSALGTFSGDGAEIPAFDPITQRTFVVTGGSNITVLDTSDPSNPTLFSTIDVSAFGSANSVAIKNGIVAVAVENENTQAPGQVVFYDLDGNVLNAVTVGSLPDMLTFSPDGNKILVANEGEPSSYDQPDSVDPEGSVSIIDISNGVLNLSESNVTTADFTAFNSQKSELIASGVRIFGPNATVAQDVEPEYITISSDSKTAWITLQENNALAILDIESGEITDIQPLGDKNHNLPGNGLDASDSDGPDDTGAINIQNWPVFGLYQPDAIASFSVNGQTYLVTANEGDARDYEGFSEEERVNDLDLDPTAFPNAEDLQDDAALGRLTVTNTLGDTDGDGDFDRLYAFGARSFSILDERGNLVYDSGDQFEQITAEQIPELFNSDGTPDTFDTRSDNKGPEPEGVVTGAIAGRTYAFIGLERTSGVLVYDVTNPTSPAFVQYINTPGDIAPEGLVFVAAENSPTGQPLLVVSNEESGTTTTYEISTASGQGYKPVIEGTAGNDTLNGGNDGEIFYGLAGNDVINAGEGNNNLYGGDGNDTLNSGTGNDILNGGTGNDIINAGEGDNQIYAGDGSDRITAGAGDDLIYGGNGSDRISAGEGVNTVFAGAGDDLIYSGSQADSIDAGAGQDTIYAGEGNNTIRGGAGNDTIYSGAGSDHIDGGTGDDTIWLSGGQDIVVLAQGFGVDTVNNFQLGQTQIGLSGGLTFGDLAITQDTGATLIEIAATGEDLARLSWVEVSSLNANSFAIV